MEKYLSIYSIDIVKIIITKYFIYTIIYMTKKKYIAVFI